MEQIVVIGEWLLSVAHLLISNPSFKRCSNILYVWCLSQCFRSKLTKWRYRRPGRYSSNLISTYELSKIFSSKNYLQNPFLSHNYNQHYILVQCIHLQTCTSSCLLSSSRLVRRYSSYTFHILYQLHDSLKSYHSKQVQGVYIFA